MNPKFEVHLSPDATNDLIDAIEWYEDQKKNLGRLFESKIHEEMGRIASNPYLYQQVYHRVRAAHPNKFPHSIFFIIDDDKSIVLVLAIQHQAQNPATWKDRIS